VSPADEYSSRLAEREALQRRLERLQGRIGAIRLLLAALAIALALLAWYGHRVSALWALLPCAAFAGAVAHHAVLRGRHLRAARAAAFYRGGLARIEDRWAGSGRQGGRFNDPHHVYAADLDLFGEGSLFELMCAARTRAGEAMLARWLLSPAAREEIRTRHECIADLRERLVLREELAVLDAGMRREEAPPTAGAQLHVAAQAQASALPLPGAPLPDEEPRAGEAPDALLSWAESANILDASWIKVLAVLLPALLIAAALLWAFVGVWSPFAGVLVVEACVLYALRARLDQVLHAAENAFEELRAFAGLLSVIEHEPFAAPAMCALVGALSSSGRSASRAMGRLATLAQLAESRENPFVAWFLAVPFLFSLQVALAAERWRRTHGTIVRTWVESAGRFEALSSIAQYAFEHPEDPVPQLLESGARFRAEGIGHPLIPLAQCVRNDVELSDRTRVLLVSGSNMSGKSTLLRAVGLNTVLAMAGAPVRARALEIGVLQVGASIRINDSLREGSSRFYAEILRLRQLNQLAERTLPLLFLLDEMLQGTNSKDRLIGAEAVLQSFIERGAIGLASTHDLALTALQAVGAGTVRNVHFEDQILEGRMRFDFKLRDGVVEKSNGLELMRAIGLRV
jgi:MutS domain V